MILDHRPESLEMLRRDGSGCFCLHGNFHRRRRPILRCDLSASSDDTLITIAFGASPGSIAIVDRDGSHAPILVEAAGWPSFKR
jgi:hypothetical protein